mgnify:CR=1 FL=1
MGLQGKKISRSRLVKILQLIHKSRSTGSSIEKLAEVCSLLGYDWGMKIFWSAAGWEVEVRSAYGLIAGHSHTDNDLLEATKTVAKKLEEDITDGSIRLPV